MKNNNIFYLLGVLLLFASSCAPKLTPFTQDLYEDYGWSEAELKKVQFYLSSPITLRRGVSSGSTEIISGKIKMINGKQMEEVVIESGTPGVLMFQPKTNRFAISFEEGGKDRYLMFGPNPKSNDRFVLLAKGWEKTQGKITYEGKTWVTPSRSAYAALMVDLRKVKQVSVDTRKARGRSID